MFGAVWAQAEVRKALACAGARVVDRELAVGLAEDQFTPNGELVEPQLVTALSEVVAALLDEVSITLALR
jgi:chromate reductase